MAKATANPVRKAKKATSVRQSVTIPAPLASQVRKIAKARHLTMSRALVAMAERGLQAELESEARLKKAHDAFMATEPSSFRQEAGKELIRSIFGDDAIAKDPI